jgi:hypothetical protein
MSWWTRLFGPKTRGPAEGFSSGPSAGWVSAWVGDLTDELDLDGYLYEFDRDHRLSERGEDGGYTVGEEAKPLDALMSEFFLARSWASRMADEGRKRGIDRASCAVIQLHYRHAPAALAPGPLRFVASIRIEAPS